MGLIMELMESCGAYNYVNGVVWGLIMELMGWYGGLL